jgi:hypothetical protein
MLAFVALGFAPMQPGRALPAAAAELDGVTLPDTRVVDGTALRLNGIAVRTFSMFQIHVYVAGLYLPQPTRDAEAILHSGEAKLLDIHFIHDVTADRAREAWLSGFRDNCRPPCRIPSNMLDEFLKRVPDIRAGDTTTLMFNGPNVEFRVDGRPMGTVTDPTFTRTILATFIGSYPSTEPLKHGLLGLPN